jgi:hypothetical protein
MPDANGNLVGGAVHGPIDPRLGPLADNGGSTLTHALLVGSPAINAGDPEAVAGVGGVPQFDQRGAPFSRVHGGRIDIGALELQPSPLAGDYNVNGAVDAADYVIWRKTLNSTTALAADGNGDGVVNQDDWQLWRTNFGLAAESGEQGAESGESEAVETLQQRGPRQPPALPGVSVATSRPEFRPATQRFAPDADLLTVLASPRTTNHDRHELSSVRRQSLSDASVDFADSNLGAVDQVFETLGQE